MVGETGFEPATSASQTQRFYQAELLPVTSRAETVSDSDIWQAEISDFSQKKPPLYLATAPKVLPFSKTYLISQLSDFESPPSGSHRCQ